MDHHTYMYKCGKYIQNLGGVVPAAEELHLGVDDDPDGGAVLLHLSKRNCWSNMASSLVEGTLKFL